MKPPDESSSPDLAPDPDFFEVSLDHICVAGFDGYWKRLNPAWTATLGWTPALAARADLKKGVPLFTFYNRYRSKDGSFRWFGWRSVSLPERELVYAVARDVTAEKKAERAREPEVTAVTSAKEALALISSGERYDIILSDLMMPEMSGMELYETILEFRPDLAERIVFITGGAFTADARAFLERIPNRWLGKPFDPTQLRALVAESIHPLREAS